MRCPSCGHDEDRVVDSRAVNESRVVRRRRECASCQHRFTTVEEISNDELVVLKRDGQREPFLRQKLLDGVGRACWKRPIGSDQLDKLTARIAGKIEDGGNREIESEEIGRLVLEQLLALDHVAYVRFASVYRKFDDIDEFVNELMFLRGQSGAEAKA
ncbi:MAG TPA: transcriptional regulator NrdR [Lentisphaeria bacterium]|nr:transcriptional regulator NrdR [Lentisphaeria bacterium]